MKTNYIGHDQVYKHKRENGETGWDEPTLVEKHFECLRKLLDMIHLPPSPYGLELGCGAGDLTIRLAKAGWQMHGVDISPTAIEWAKEKTLAFGLNIEFHLADLVCENLLPIEPVDAVIDGHCLHCIIGRDRGSFFGFAKKHLKRSGFLLIDTMCGDPWMDETKRHFDATTRCLVHNGVASRYLGMEEEILQEITDAGFSIIKSKVIKASEPKDQHTLLVAAHNIP